MAAACVSSQTQEQVYHFASHPPFHSNLKYLISKVAALAIGVLQGATLTTDVQQLRVTPATCA